MENDPRAVKVAWTIWTIFVVAYLVMNTYLVKSNTLETEKLVTGMGIAMPIICNLAWWAVGFRLRLRINHWWAFGFLTSLVVGVAGFMTMWAVAKKDVDSQAQLHIPRLFATH